MVRLLRLRNGALWLLSVVLVLFSIVVAYSLRFASSRVTRAPTQTKSFTALLRRSGTHPRDYYMGLLNSSCVTSLLGRSSDHQFSDHESNDRTACFSGSGVQIAILDTGLCPHISAWSRNNVTCTSFVPGVACGDVGCGHGTRSLSVLAGHLISPALFDNQSSKETSSKARSTEWYGKQKTAFSRQHYIGMAPLASARVFRVFDRQGRTHERYLTSALDVLLREAEAYLQAQRSQNGSGIQNHSNVFTTAPPCVDIVSLSYGSEDYYGNTAIQVRLHRLMHHYGVLVVAAAGNDHYRFGSVRSPADMPGVLAVGAVRLIQHRATSKRSAKQQEIHRQRQQSPVLPALFFEKSVAGFSGRGPTTWELPFGAGRVKPDLVALGQDVWAVEGAAPFSTTDRLSRGVVQEQQLQLRPISGTSVAAPIVAGVLALLLEAVRWQAKVRAESLSVWSRNSIHGHKNNSYLVARLNTSMHVRQLLLDTAEPLTPAFENREEIKPALFPPASNARARNGGCPPVARIASGASNTTFNRELAGVPLTQLYAGYLQLTRWSILSQGMGEVQPRRALTSILQPPPKAAAVCASFAIPPSLHVGDGGVDWMNDCEALTLASSTTRTPRFSKTTSPLYWWPYSDMAVFPGAAPLLFNLSVHLCPSPANHHFSVDTRTANKDNLSHHAQIEGNENVNSPYVLSFEFTKVTAHPLRSTNEPCVGKSANSAVLLTSKGREKTEAVQQNLKWRLLKRHLLRVALRLKEVSAPPGLSPHLSPLLPATAYTLSAALYVPPTAHTRLRYCAEASTPASSARDIVDLFENDERSDINNTVGTQFLNGTKEQICVPFFHAFSDVTVEGEIRIYGHNQTTEPVSSSFQQQQEHSLVLLVIPIVTHIAAPPPRSQRVLIDTSLDWLNPTAATSNLFIAGDDPHEAASQTFKDGAYGDNSGSNGRAYAEVGGDHPHTNLALLHVYMRHCLGLAVNYFPLLHVATAPVLADVSSTSAWFPAESSTVPHNLSFFEATKKPAFEIAAATLSEVGTLIVVDPERPLSHPMRALLTAAVQPQHEKDGLNVVLISDWYSAEVAASMRWARDVNDYSNKNYKSHHLSETTGNEDRGCASAQYAHSDVLAKSEPCTFLDSWDTQLLRPWRMEGKRSSSAVPDKTPKQSFFRGLRGSCHVPSWNCWFDELTFAATAVYEREHCNSSTRCEQVSETGAQKALGAPFRLSEDSVLDGVFVVAAGQALPSNGSVAPSHGKQAFRSLGQLNAAGVLHWASGSSEHVNKSRSDSDVRSAGKATLCNVMPSWSRLQQRLRKRLLGSPDIATSTEAEVATYEDIWENLEEGSTNKNHRFVAHLDDVNVDVLSENTSPTARGEHADALVSRALSRGILGFLQLPRLLVQSEATATQQQQQHGPAMHPVVKAGRLAVFTDSNCFSADDHHLQSVLQELDRLTSASDTPLDALNSKAGQFFVRKESVQTSTCVEVMKELLHWSLTGDEGRWREEVQLQCETRTWPSSLTSQRQFKSNSVEGDVPSLKCRSDNVDDSEDLLCTAPERASVGAVVTRLWIATVFDVISDKHDAGFEKLCMSSLATVCVDHHTTSREPVRASLPVSTTVSQVLWGRFAAHQNKAEQEVLVALSTQYHGDWDAYVREHKNGAGTHKLIAQRSNSYDPRQ